MSDPTPSQALLLFGLLVRHGECPQAELMPAIVAKDREALVIAKLIEVKKVGRSFVLKLVDAGWAWTSAHLAAELPPAQRTLGDLLQRLGEYLARKGETLADFIGSKPKVSVPTTARVSSEAKPKTTKPKSKSAKPTKSRSANKTPTAKTKAESHTPTTSGTKKGAISNTSKPLTAAGLRRRIEAAYLFITNNRKNESVRLSKLRDALSDLDRATVDAGLARILRSDKKASLMRHDDPRQLDQADRDATFNPAGDPFHVIWIAS